MISYEISGKTCSTVDVILHVPSERLPDLLSLLEKVDRVDNDRITQQKRVAALVEAGKLAFEVTRRMVVNRYVSFIDQGRDPLDSISLTVKILKDQRPNITYEGVKAILSQTGVLKTTGFYQAQRERKVANNV
ncbi:MAG: hypothetical protein WBI04_07155 [Trichlorobacter sp.]